MWSALGWGLFAGSSLIIGGVIALAFDPRAAARPDHGVRRRRPDQRRLVQLVAEAVETSAGSGGVALGLAAGALTFAGDALIDRMGGEGRKRMKRAAGGSALAIVLGIVLDGIPESAVIGLGLLDGGGE